MTISGREHENLKQGYLYRENSGTDNLENFLSVAISVVYPGRYFLLSVVLLLQFVSPSIRNSDMYFLLSVVLLLQFVIFFYLVFKIVENMVLLGCGSAYFLTIKGEYGRVNASIIGVYG